MSDTVNKLQFKFNNSEPIYLQIIEQLEHQIAAGFIPPGSKLPSVRDLAQLSRSNPNTVVRALDELERKNLIYTERTTGKFVINDPDFIKQYRNIIISREVHKFLQKVADLSLTHDEFIEILNTSPNHSHTNN